MVRDISELDVEIRTLSARVYETVNRKAGRASEQDVADALRVLSVAGEMVAWMMAHQGPRGRG